MWRKIAPVLLATILLFTSASALEWEFKETSKFPEQVSNGSSTVLVTRLTVDDEGDTVDYIKPTRCDSLDTVYSYKGEVKDLEYIDGSEGYFYGAINADTSDKEISLKAEGEKCDPFTGDTSSSIRIFPPTPSETLMLETLEERFDFSSTEGFTNNGATSTRGIQGENDAAYLFSEDHLQVDNEELPPEDFEEYTYSAWIKPDSKDGRQAVISKNDENYTSGIQLGLDSSSAFFSTFWEDSSKLNEKQENQVGAGSLDQEKWHHIAGTVRETEDGGYNLTVYANGETSSDSFDNYNHTKNIPFIGAAYNRTGEIKHGFDGRIDEVRFYSEALSKNQLQELTDSGFTGFYDTEINESKELFLETEEDSFEFNGNLEPLNEDVKGDETNWEHVDYLGNPEGEKDFSVPSNPESLYIMKLYGDPQENYPPFASEEGAAVPITIKQEVEGEVSFQHDGERCNEGVTKCEKDTNVTVLVKEVQSQADNVSVVIKDNGDEIDSFNATRKNSTHWEGHFKIPENTNSSEFEAEATLKNPYSEDVTSSFIETNPFILKVDSDSNYEIRGNEITLQAYPETPYTSELYPLSNIDKATFIVYDPSGDEIERKTLDEDVANYFNTQGGMVEYSYRIPVEAEHGEYEFKASLTDKSGFEEESERESFTVRDVDVEPSDVRISDIGSSIDDEDGVEEISKDFVGKGSRDGSIVVKNHGDIKGDVKVNFTGDLKDIGSIKEVNNGETSPFTLHPSSQAVVDVEFDFQETGDYTGGITFNVTDELESYSVKIDAEYTVEAACEIQSGDICILDSTVSEEILEEETSFPVTLKNQLNEEQDLSYSVASGNLTSIVSSGTESLNAGEETGIDIPVDLTAEDNGYYEGELEFSDQNSSASVPVSLEVAIPVGSMEIDISETDFGQVLEGETVETDITATNTGDVDFGWVRVQGSREDIDFYIEDSSGERVSLEAGSSETGTIELDTSRLGTGDYTGSNSIEVVGKSDTSARDTGNLEIEVVEDISSDIEDVSSEITMLESEIESLGEGVSSSDISDFESKLSDIEDLSSTAQDEWDDGDYSAAKKTFKELEKKKGNLKSDISNAESQTSTEKDTDSTETEEPSETPEEDGGGLSVWVFIVPLLFLIIMGAVLYLSIVPEE